jgi:threonine/homoserine/homoserine lactone efflux protein
MTELNLWLIMAAALIGVASPGPSTLAIAGTAMAQGKRRALALATGITLGSLTWSVAAAAGLSALMLANLWAVEVLRYLGAAYLLFLALKSLRSACSPGAVKASAVGGTTLKGAVARGLALHLTNPKAIFFFGSLYAIGVPQGASPAMLLTVITAVGLQSALVFHLYAVLFSHPRVMTAYSRLRRPLEGLFAAAFGTAALKIMTARIGAP